MSFAKQKTKPTSLQINMLKGHRFFIVLRTRTKHCTVGHLGSGRGTPLNLRHSLLGPYTHIYAGEHTHIHTQRECPAHADLHPRTRTTHIYTEMSSPRMPCTSWNVLDFLLHRLYALPDEHSQPHSTRLTPTWQEFCSQLIDQFFWEAFLDHPRKVLVLYRVYHTLHNITQNCDYNFSGCFS